MIHSGRAPEDKPRSRQKTWGGLGTNRDSWQQGHRACIDQTEIWQHRVANSRQRNVIGAAEQQTMRRGVRTERANEWKALGEAECDLPLLSNRGPFVLRYSTLMSRLTSQSSAVVLKQTCRGWCQLEVKRITFQMLKTKGSSCWSSCSHRGSRTQIGVFGDILLAVCHVAYTECLVLTYSALVLWPI
jgi:hypothetical protein